MIHFILAWSYNKLQSKKKNSTNSESHGMEV